ncbi:Predicted DNA-binding transcriptional regulator YafY, contains an HTH and WYL domains [Rhizobiales bacterium GAS191]|nr:Predicted DNA-binding transcriptional regulator YafY, contains an HTH and WYL domains [Rhizobiales bacterium GAS113]SEC21431.1 Predicted DNA-binding transcriptional regulator YafY, contains an HTH and WYL domains [Rhizobiales bacterium GAS188]SED03030.1 Predicted DNA-binding transcriptional regulator YafY, contains an HTH and WYL domains [Rhizobiales bacterium GAS191]
MSRAERLLELIQILRRHRRPVSGHLLAEELGISLRSLYRDIRALQAQGAAIDGEPGLGYILRPGFMLPPLMFQEEEIEALVLGSRWVAKRGDARLGAAARNALAKIAAVLPQDLRDTLDATTLLVGSGAPIAAGDAELSLIRQAIRTERKLAITYESGGGGKTERTVWPFALGFFDRVRVVAAWCELRQGYRNFRTDRIAALTVTETRYPRRRLALLKEWREVERIPPQKA